MLKNSFAPNLINSIYTITNKLLFLLMGYTVKIQKVDRGLTKSYYINFPAALAESANMEKGEEWEWELEDKNSFILKRVKKLPLRKVPKTKG
jgi:antitoxin component of MazEF toxin-antitoxin module